MRYMGNMRYIVYSINTIDSILFYFILCPLQNHCIYYVYILNMYTYTRTHTHIYIYIHVYWCYILVNSAIPTPWCDSTWCNCMCQVSFPADLSCQDTNRGGQGLWFIPVGRFMVLWAVAQKLRIHLAWDALVLSFVWQEQQSFWQGHTIFQFGRILICRQCD